MAGNWFDLAIGAVAPQYGLRRLRAKEAFARAYTGATVDRHTDGWRTASTSGDAEIYAAGRKLRDRSRELGRNNPHAAKAVSVWTTNIVGEGIVPRPNTGDEKRNAKIKAVFEDWVEDCDADGKLDFYGMQTLACREMVEAGEVLGRRRWRRESDGYRVPVQVQLLESDYLDDSRHGMLDNKNTAIQGIEFGFTGKPQAYWMFQSHPGNNFFDFSMTGGNSVSSPVPASEIVHLFERQRATARGVPWCAPSMASLKTFEDYEFAELIRKRTESSVVGVVTSDDLTDETVSLQVTDSRGNVVEKFAPGMFLYARGGKEIKFNSPAVIGGYGEYKQAALRTIAAGYRIPYELLSGDLSQVNFSSARVGIVEFRRLVRQIQWHLFIPMYLQPIWLWFVEAAYLAGEIDIPVVPVIWAPPKFDWVDPHSEALADLIAIRSGTKTWDEVVAERGGDPGEVLDTIQKHNSDADARGIVLDSDPRMTNLRGMLQKLIPDQPGMENDLISAGPAGGGGGGFASVHHLDVREGRKK